MEPYPQCLARMDAFRSEGGTARPEDSCVRVHVGVTARADVDKGFAL